MQLCNVGVIIRYSSDIEQGRFQRHISTFSAGDILLRVPEKKIIYTCMINTGEECSDACVLSVMHVLLYTTLVAPVSVL